MINKYTIHNFKNHSDSHFEFGNLNIFTGLNGMGKSSVIQSMLLLRDSYFKNQDLKTLFLDVDSVEVGRSAGLVNCNIEEDQDVLKLGLLWDEIQCDFLYQYTLGDEDFLVAKDVKDMPDSNVLKKCPLFNENFQYLSAFRSGPQPIYNSSSIVDKRHQISYKQGRGEYAVYYLHKYRDEEIPIKELMYSESTSQSLYSQTEFWMNEVSKNIKFKLDQSGKDFKLSFGYERWGKVTSYHSAMNTGYGVSYILSLIVSILSAKPGSLIIIENPEAHIHPSGQAALMKMISIAAKNGVQFIIETHSDHILNGALVNAKKNIINQEQIKVYFFELDDKLNSNPQLLRIEPCGRIQEAPLGFFDQMDSDTEILFDITETF